MIQLPPPVFVISLARAKERRADIVRRLQECGLQYEIVDAVDGEELNLADYADRLNRRDAKEGSCFRWWNDKGRHNYPLTKTQIGCHLSHYRLWERIVRERIPAAVILEDDAVWEDDFAAVISAAAACDWEWDLIQLFSGQQKRVHRTLQPLRRHYNLVQLRGPSNVTAAYLISRSGAEKLVKHAYLMHHTVDVVWQDYWNWNGRVYAVRPYPANVADVPSTILESGVRTAADRGTKCGFFAAIRYSLFKKKYQAINGFYRFWIRPKRK